MTSTCRVEPPRADDREHRRLDRSGVAQSNRGFAVLGFPCNQFGRQEPGSASDILCFTKERYSVSFPLFAKVEVNGENQHPLYKYLKHRAKGLLGTESIKWNFTKFLSDRHGEIVARFGPATTPSTIEARIESLLG